MQGQQRRRIASATRQMLPTTRPAQAMASGGSVAVGVGRQDEVHRQAHRRSESPQHADRVEMVAAGDVQHQGQPDQRRACPGHGQPAWTLPVAEPQPAHHEQDAEVFQQQCDARPTAAAPR